MKTKGLTFLEAVRALGDGKCEEIKNIPSGCIYRRNGCGTICYAHIDDSLSDGIGLTPNLYLGEWEIASPKPRTEERVLEYWLIVWKHGAVSTSVCQPSTRVYEQAQHITHTYIYTFPEDD